MDRLKQIQIYQCINFLKNHGYDVIERKGNKVGKYVAFTQDGMTCVLHGKVITDYVGTYCVRCKNGYQRIVGLDSVIGFYDTKQECYAITKDNIKR